MVAQKGVMVRMWWGNKGFRWWRIRVVGGVAIGGVGSGALGCMRWGNRGCDGVGNGSKWSLRITIGCGERIE